MIARAGGGLLDSLRGSEAAALAVRAREPAELVAVEEPLRRREGVAGRDTEVSPRERARGVGVSHALEAQQEAAPVRTRLREANGARLLVALPDELEPGSQSLGERRQHLRRDLSLEPVRAVDPGDDQELGLGHGRSQRAAGRTEAPARR
jgi:hypothetical protein